MKLVNKFIIICNNEKEFIENQKFLFSRGYIWCSAGNEVITFKDLCKDLCSEYCLKHLNNNEKTILCEYTARPNRFYFRFIYELNHHIKQGYTIINNNLKLDLE